MSSPLTLDSLVLPLVEGKKILDIGCGKGKWGFLLRTNWWCTKNGSGYEEPELLIGIDLFTPFLRKAKYHKIYEDVVRCSGSFLPFKTNSFDTVIASEVIEHMDKASGELLLAEMERVARRVVIITTPNILRKRGGLLTSEGFNPYEKHETRWSIGYLRNRGYKIYGVGFLPFIFFPLLNSLFSPLSWLFPFLSTHLLGVKKLQQNHKTGTRGA